MKNVKEWREADGTTIVKCVRKNTVLLHDLDSNCLLYFDELEKELSFEFVITESLTDLLALPAFLSVVNPLGIHKGQLQNHINSILEFLGPDDCFYLFTDDIDITLPDELSNTILPWPRNLNKESLKAIILFARDNLKNTDVLSAEANH